jgi:hypothetical protein
MAQSRGYSLSSDTRVGGPLAVLQSCHAELSGEGKTPAIRRSVRQDASARQLTCDDPITPLLRMPMTVDLSGSVT